MRAQVEESVGELDKTRTDLALREDDHQLVSEALLAKDEELAKRDEELQIVKSRLQEVCDQVGCVVFISIKCHIFYLLACSVNTQRRQTHSDPVHVHSGRGH